MRGTHEHGPSAVIMGGPNKSGQDGKRLARLPLADQAFLRH
jgi:hypothetical protein